MNPRTIIDTFTDLVAFPTVTGDRDAAHEAFAYISHFLLERGLYVHRHESNGFESLVATTQPTKTPRVMLAAHLDVVPAAPRLFKLEQRNGRLYGRGSCDMKFAIAAYLQLVDDLQEDIRLYDFGIVITSDEEVGGENGMKRLLELGYRAEAFVLPDGGDNWALEQSAKGVIWATVTASGQSAHASRPWEGENAIEKMMLFLQATQRELFAAQNEHSSTLNIGVLQGGSAANQVADVCTAKLDIRTLNTEEHCRITARLRELSQQYDVSLEMPINDPPISVDMGDPFVVAYAKSVEKAIGRPMQTVRSNGGSDARHIAHYNIPALVAYPNGGGRHSDEEWIETESLFQFRDVIHDYLTQTATMTPTPEFSALETLTSIQ